VKKTSKTYVICWDGSIDNCLDLDRQLSSSDLDHLFFNVSSTEVSKDSWVSAENVRYYGHVHNALKDFVSSDYDIFIFNAGDPTYSDWVGYTKRVETIMSMDENIYAIAPDTINDLFSGEGSFIEESKIFKNLNLSTHTNGIQYALSRDLALIVKDYLDWAVERQLLRFPEMVSGWGLDTAFCSMAIYLNKKIYRDKSITVFHPPGSTLNDDKSNKEMMAVLMSFKLFCSDRNLDIIKLQDLYDMIHKKVRERSKYQLTASELYVNLEGDIFA
jgi:hypothetical protein